MKGFDKLWGKAVDHVQGELGFDEGSNASIIDLLEDASLFDRISLLARGAAGGEGGRADAAAFGRGAKAASSTPEFQGTGFSESDIGDVLKQTFAEGKPPQDALKNDELWSVAIEKLAEESGISVSRDQATQVVRLVRTGEVFRDTGSALFAIAPLARDLPIKVLQDVKPTVLESPGLIIAVLRDTGEFVIDVPDFIKGLADGEDGVVGDDKVLAHTMRWVYRRTSVESIARTMQLLIADDNESIRLAIILYARANGLNVTEDDLDRLRDQVFNAKDPDLGPVLDAGIREYLKGDKVEAAVSRISKLVD